MLSYLVEELSSPIFLIELWAGTHPDLDLSAQIGKLRSRGKEEGLLGFTCLPTISSLARWGSGRCGESCPACDPSSAPHPLTLAVFRLTEALLLFRETVADTEASFYPPAVPWLVPTNDAAAPW